MIIVVQIDIWPNIVWFNLNGKYVHVENI